MTTVNEKDYDGKLSCSHVAMADRTGIKEQIRKVMKQPEYDDGSAGPVFVRCVLNLATMTGLIVDLHGMLLGIIAWSRYVEYKLDMFVLLIISTMEDLTGELDSKRD